MKLGRGGREYINLLIIIIIIIKEWKQDYEVNKYYQKLYKIPTLYWFDLIVINNFIALFTKRYRKCINYSIILWSVC